MDDRFIFRGKQEEDGAWIQGYLVEKWWYGTNSFHILEGIYGGDQIGGKVIGKTIGQCTGLKDKNGKLIFEGDIIYSNMSLHIDNVWNNWVVGWNNNTYGTTGFVMKLITDDKDCGFPREMCIGHSSKYEIIGTIYDDIK